MNATLLIIAIVNILFGQNAIIVPDALTGNVFNLTLQNGSYSFYDGFETTTMGANGNILGPTLIMNKGDDVDIYVNNQLADTTTIHWHGMHVSAENDGGPHTTIAPGTTWNPQFTVLDKAGTYWYHPHLHQKTDLHVSKGIAGFIIVRDEEESALNLPRSYGVDDFPLVIQTKTFDSNREIVVPSNADSALMVNATRNAVLDVPAQIVRFRLLDGSSQRVFNIGLNDNQTFYQIASDGGLLASPNEITRLQLAPGERNEILIDFSGMEGQTVSLKSYASEFPNGIYGATYPGVGAGMTLNGYNPNPLNGTDFTIIQFNVNTATSNPVTELPSTLATLEPLLEANADTTREFTLSPESMGMNALNDDFLINGASFDMDVINEIIPLNNTEIWSILNDSPIAHPFHIHDVQFFILDRNGVAPSTEESGRKDVILIKAEETIRFITKFEDFADDEVPYMYHCHMLVHEDAGMMGQFIVVDNSPPAGIDDSNNVPNQFKLFPVFPNPFNPSTTIRFNIGVEGQHATSLLIYDLTGQLIETLLEEKMEPGTHEIQWNAANQPSGVYFVQIESGSFVQTKKMVLLK